MSSCSATHANPPPPAAAALEMGLDPQLLHICLMPTAALTSATLGALLQKYPQNSVNFCILPPVDSSVAYRVTALWSLQMQCADWTLVKTKIINYW